MSWPLQRILIKQIRDKEMKVCDVVLTVVIYWPCPCHSPSPFVIPHSLIFICSPVISHTHTHTLLSLTTTPNLLSLSLFPHILSTSHPPHLLPPDGRYIDQFLHRPYHQPTEKIKEIKWTFIYMNVVILTFSGSATIMWMSALTKRCCRGGGGGGGGRDTPRRGWKRGERRLITFIKQVCVVLLIRDIFHSPKKAFGIFFLRHLTIGAPNVMFGTKCLQGRQFVLIKRSHLNPPTLNCH